MHPAALPDLWRSPWGGEISNWMSLERLTHVEGISFSRNFWLTYMGYEVRDLTQRYTVHLFFFCPSWHSLVCEVGWCNLVRFRQNPYKKCSFSWPAGDHELRQFVSTCGRGDVLLLWSLWGWSVTWDGTEAIVVSTAWSNIKWSSLNKWFGLSLILTRQSFLIRLGKMPIVSWLHGWLWCYWVGGHLRLRSSWDRGLDQKVLKPYSPV